MPGWVVDRIVHFTADDFVVSGLAHFGFHVRDGRYYAISHRRHYLGLVDPGGCVAWTAAPRPVFPGVVNIAAELEYPIYVDALPDGTLLVANFGNARLVRLDPEALSAQVLVDGSRLGMRDMGNCVVDGHGSIWVNEVTGCRIWRFDEAGRVVETLGDGVAGFQADTVEFERVRFNWVYDLRLGPDGSLYVLDSKNFALRAIDPVSRTVRLVVGPGVFGSDPAARFDGPISLSLDDTGAAYVGDRFNHLVRKVEPESGSIATVAGRPDASAEEHNDPAERDPLRLNLPQISSLDYDRGCLYVPTDLADGSGDLAVLRTAP